MRRRISFQAKIRNYWLRLLVCCAVVLVVARHSVRAGLEQSSDKVREQRRANQCQAVYFWGGGKAGSTTLATYLKHGEDGSAWDPSGEFVDAGKEVCWAESGAARLWDRAFAECDSEHWIALDACPRYRSRQQLTAILTKHPDAKFVMLVRDPVDRIVSHLNDDCRRGGNCANIETRVRELLQRRSGVRWELSQFGALLRVLLEAVPPSRVLIVRTEALSASSQDITDSVLAFVGATRNKQVRAHRSNNGRVAVYRDISAEMRAALQRALAPDAELLFYLVGRRFPWSWVAAAGADDWHVAHPTPLPPLINAR